MLADEAQSPCTSYPTHQNAQDNDSVHANALSNLGRTAICSSDRVRTNNVTRAPAASLMWHVNNSNENITLSTLTADRQMFNNSFRRWSWRDACEGQEGLENESKLMKVRGKELMACLHWHASVWGYWSFNSPKDGWMASDSRHFTHANSGYIMKGQRSKNDSNSIVTR